MKKYLKFPILAMLIFFLAAVMPPGDVAAEEDNGPETSANIIIDTKDVEAVNINPASKKISLDIKGMDIVDVLKMFAARAQINVVVGKNVKGNVSMFLRDVNIWDAFEIIVLANGLAYEREGDIVNVMTQKDYEEVYGTPYKDKREIELVRLQFSRAKELLPALTQLKSKIGKVVLDETSNSLILMDTRERIEKMRKVIWRSDLPVQTRIFSVNYANVKVLSEKLNEMLTKGLGSIKLDERTSKLAITDTPKKLEEMGKVIRAFDEKPRQVLINAQIIELKPSDKFEMGIDWDYWIDKHFRVSAPFAGVSGETKLSVGTIGETVSAKDDYTAVVDMLQTLGDTKILSSPRIMVVDGQEASMLVGSKEAYLTSSTTQVGDSASTTETVNFVDVGIKLYVTPQVSKEGFITMQIKPEVSSSELVDFGTATNPKKIPIVTTSEAQTTVVVKDGTTIIIGGLRKDEKSKIVKQIPVLGNIPILNFFTKNVSEEISTTDLVILLTPNLVSGDMAITDISQIKPKDGVVLKMKKGEIEKEQLIQKDEDR